VEKAEFKAGLERLVTLQALLEFVNVVGRIGMPCLRPRLIGSAYRSEIEDTDALAVVAALFAERQHAFIVLAHVVELRGQCEHLTQC
jgi:hypothetical protein